MVMDGCTSERADMKTVLCHLITLHLAFYILLFFFLHGALSWTNTGGK